MLCSTWANRLDFDVNDRDLKHGLFHEWQFHYFCLKWCSTRYSLFVLFKFPNSPFLCMSCWIFHKKKFEYWPIWYSTLMPIKFIWNSSLFLYLSRPGRLSLHIEHFIPTQENILTIFGLFWWHDIFRILGSNMLLWFQLAIISIYIYWSL